MHMHAFLIVGQSTPERGREMEKLLASRQIARSPLHRFVLSPRQLREKETYGIEDIRSLIRWTSQLHQQPGAVIIEESERLTKPAQHALLKTLEEGSPNMTMVLSAVSEQSLLPTIRSRCRIIRVREKSRRLTPPDEGTKMIAWLEKLSSKEPARRILELYRALSKMTGKTISPHFGSIQRQDGQQFVEKIINILHQSLQGSAPPSAGQSLYLRFAVIAYRRLRQNQNVALALQQFVLDIPSRT